MLKFVRINRQSDLLPLTASMKEIPEGEAQELIELKIMHRKLLKGIANENVSMHSTDSNITSMRSVTLTNKTEAIVFISDGVIYSTVYDPGAVQQSKVFSYLTQLETAFRTIYSSETIRGYVAGESYPCVVFDFVISKLESKVLE